MGENYETVKLPYSIYEVSSYSSHYVPENIIEDNPKNQLSRWFTDSNTPSQYIMLKLQSPAIVETIKFGKYLKPHVSDLKKFQIFGGMEENNLSLLLTAGLKKDCSPETFRLRQRTAEGLDLPVQFVKIVPIQSWGPAYNYTIWHVELRGKNNDELINRALETINLRKEEEAVRLLLKHLRRRRYKDAFEALSRESGVQLEGALQARLWNAMVESGDYKLAETILEEAKTGGDFDWYISWQPYQPSWRLLSACSNAVEDAIVNGPPPVPIPRHLDLCCLELEEDYNVNITLGFLRQAATYSLGVRLHGFRKINNGEPLSPDDPVPPIAGGMPDAIYATSCRNRACCSKPGPRGGHQLVVDSNTGNLYLYGGWNGSVDLADLWCFDTTTEKWSQICDNSFAENGPTPRSCHKMVFDPANRRLYTLGRYLDNTQRVRVNMKSDMYMFDLVANEWQLVCADTAAAGGPRLVFDHQMCIDADTQIIYVFGGRVLPYNTEEALCPQYSGLYAYYIRTNTWEQLLPDEHQLDAPQPRVSHSMLFHPGQRRLYIFAGQRNKNHMLDLWWYDVATGETRALCSTNASPPPPSAGFTQRATIDPDLDEIYVLSGMSKEKDKRVHNTLWMFSLRRQTWTCVYRNDTINPNEPRPRFAHQLVYDPVNKVHYLFGGNPGNHGSPRLRLDDLWALKLIRPTVDNVFNTARATVREAHYRELCAVGQDLEAVQFLQNDLCNALDHSDPEQVSRFQKLATLLFSGAPSTSGEVSLNARRTRILGRRKAEQTPQPDLAQALQQVLGAEDANPDAPVPFEDWMAPLPDTWDVASETDDDPPSQEWGARSVRLALYDVLSRYFRPSTVPPVNTVMDLVTF